MIVSQPSLLRRWTNRAVVGARSKSPYASVPLRFYDIPLYQHHRQAFSHQLKSYASRPITPVDIQSLIEGGKAALENPKSMLAEALALYHELPTRLAKCAEDLQTLPYGLSDTEPITIVRQLYENSFRDVTSCLPPTQHTETQFLAMIERILWRHNSVVPLIAQGILQRKDYILQINNGKLCPYVSKFLDNFYMSRIAIRILITHYIALHYPQPNCVGNIALHLNPIPVMRHAAEDAASICERTYGAAPDVRFSFTTHASPDVAELELGTELAKTLEHDDARGAGLSVSYVPNHLHHIIFELTKNSMRAVVERYGANHYDLPPIELLVVSGEDALSIRISDTGGGIPPDHVGKLFSWLHTTASNSVQNSLKNINYGHIELRSSIYRNSGVGIQRILSGKMEKKEPPVDDNLLRNETMGGIAPIAGFGYGLPLSRLYARFFGGDISIKSVAGHGVDAYVSMPKLEHNRTKV